MENVLITGATGFIGSNLIPYLTERGYRIYGHSRNPKYLQSAYGDCLHGILTDCSAESLRKNQIESIIHLAGIAHDLSKRFKESDYFQVNTQSSCDLFDAWKLLQNQNGCFVFMSSVKAVSDQGALDLDETVKPEPVSAYGRSKYMAEKYIIENSGDTMYYILRPCMVHGPGNKGNLNLLYRFVKMGLPYPLGIYDNQRSLLSVENLCYSIENILRKPIDRGIYHVADSGTISTREIVDAMADVLGQKGRIWNVPKSIIEAGASIGSSLNLPFNQNRLNKLTESLTLSNKKLLLALSNPLPLDLKTGLKSTLESFL
ncbi:MAG: NAD-dependent epimerase/dehydratase family protein [Cyclobacteriaceae bacterium]|nr:NAD-dependent epimerase/dehydratase family protein [Cyclobacteriaceae bacterium]